MQDTQYLELEKEQIYSQEQIGMLSKVNIPKHVAIIMDGNRRWAINQGLAGFQGHYQGAKQLDYIVKSAIELGISTLTVFAFSTENWKRSEKEVSILMRLLKSQLLDKKEAMKVIKLANKWAVEKKNDNYIEQTSLFIKVIM